MLLSNAVLLFLVLDKTPAFVTNLQVKLVQLWSSASAKWDHLLALIIAVAVGVVLWPVYSSHMLNEAHGMVFAGGSCWADLPIHMHVAESFLQGRNQDVSWGQMHSPVFAGERMVYPFLPDFHAAIIKKLGGSLREAFLFTGLALAVSLAVLFYFFALRVSRSRLGAVFGIALSAFAGGMGGINHARKNGSLWSATLVDSMQDDVGPNGQGKLFWFAFLPHVLMPQVCEGRGHGGE
jgi:hypothetical protein